MKNLKKLWIIAICLMLALMLFACKKTEQAETPVEEEATPIEVGSAAEATPEPLAYEEEHLVRLESVQDNADGTVQLNVTEMILTDPEEGQTDTDYTLKEGEKKQYVMVKDGTVDFPMAENQATTVTLTAGELSGELQDYHATAGDNNAELLFTAKMKAGQVVELTHVYLP